MGQRGGPAAATDRPTNDPPIRCRFKYLLVVGHYASRWIVSHGRQLESRRRWRARKAAAHTAFVTAHRQLTIPAVHNIFYCLPAAFVSILCIDGAAGWSFYKYVVRTPTFNGTYRLHFDYVAQAYTTPQPPHLCLTARTYCYTAIWCQLQDILLIIIIIILVS